MAEKYFSPNFFFGGARALLPPFHPSPMPVISAGWQQFQHELWNFPLQNVCYWWLTVIDLFNVYVIFFTEIYLTAVDSDKLLPPPGGIVIQHVCLLVGLSVSYARDFYFSWLHNITKTKSPIFVRFEVTVQGQNCHTENLPVL